MATSGTVNTGYQNYTRFYLTWRLVEQDITNNRSLIAWEIGVQGTAGFTAYWYSNAVRINSGYVNGQQVSGSQTYSNITLAGSGRHALRSGSIWVGHNSDGSKTFSSSVSGWLFGNGDRSASDSFALPTIPRNSQVSTNLGSYTLGDPITIITNRKSTSFTHTITIRLNNGSGAILQTINNVGASIVWTPTAGQITTMQEAIPNTNTLALHINQYNNQVKANSSVSRNLTLTEANPTFTNFTFKDSNASVVTITGSDQVLVKGQSTLEVKVPSADKMVAIKAATAVRYAFAYEGASNQVNYGTGDVTSSFSDIQTTGNRTIQVTAFDSRSNSTLVAKSVTVYDYAVPTISTTLTRENNFGSDTTVLIQGTYSTLVIGGTNKNELTTGSLEYRYREAGETWGSWTTRSFTANTTEGTYTITDFVISLDNQKKFEFEFRINDKFGQVTSSTIVDVGTPIVFIGEKSGNPTLEVGGNTVMQSHIGMVITSTALSTASAVEAIYGGTWTAFAEGRVVVGKASSGTFSTPGATVGSETHTLTEAQIPAHSHQQRAAFASQGIRGLTSSTGAGGAGSGKNFTTASQGGSGDENLETLNKGGGQSHNNIQPSKVAYMWERTA